MQTREAVKRVFVFYYVHKTHRHAGKDPDVDTHTQIITCKLCRACERVSACVCVGGGWIVMFFRLKKRLSPAATYTHTHTGALFSATPTTPPHRLPPPPPPPPPQARWGRRLPRTPSRPPQWDPPPHHHPRRRPVQHFLVAPTVTRYDWGGETCVKKPR